MKTAKKIFGTSPSRKGEKKKEKEKEKTKGHLNLSP
jgi:hypothetical protein